MESNIWLAKLKLDSDTIKKDDNRMLQGFSERRLLINYVELLTETLTNFCQVTADQIHVVFNELTELLPTEKWVLVTKCEH